MSSKYHQDEPFNDPIVVCDSCAEIQLTATVKDRGRCEKCGNRKFRNVQVVSESMVDKIKTMNLDPEFIALFEEVQ
jgi:hypothetical protein